MDFYKSRQYNTWDVHGCRREPETDRKNDSDKNKFW